MFKIKIIHIIIILLLIYCLICNLKKKEYFTNDKKLVLITGTTSGIGKQLIKAFEKEKYKVIIHGRNKSKLNKIKDKYQDKYDIETICYDLSHKENIIQFVNELVSRFSKIDILINNFYDSSNPQNIWYQLNTNFSNNILFLEKISYIISNNGKIINISSGIAESINSNGTFIDIYAVIKSSIEKYTKIFASKLYLNNIGVTCLKIDDSYKTPLTVKFLENTSLKDPKELINVFKQLVETNWKEITGKVILSSSLVSNLNIKYFDSNINLENDSVYKLLEDSNKKNKIVGNNINPQSSNINKVIRKGNWNFSKYASETGQLKNILVNKHMVTEENILFHNGTINFLDKIISIFVKENHEIITTEDCWGILNSIGINQNKNIIRVENIYSKYIEINFNRLALSINSNTRLIYLVGPIYKSQFELFLKKIPKHLIIVIDFCYNEFFPNENKFIEMGDYLNNNVISVNTFSKFYSIPGINLSYSICNKELNKILKQYFYYPISNFIEIVAITAMNDKERNRKNISYYNSERNRISKLLKRKGIKHHLTYQNSVYIKTKLKEDEIESLLKKNNINKEIIFINNYYTFAIINKELNNKIISIIID